VLGPTSWAFLALFTVAALACIGAGAGIWHLLGVWGRRRAARRASEKRPARQVPHPPPAAPGSHGGLLKTVYIYHCGRTVIADHAKRTKRTVPCSCVPGCALCTWKNVWRGGRKVRVLERCPPHQQHERQP
jgi:hypothetical protein